MLGTSAMGTHLLSRGPGWRMVTPHSSRVVSAVLDHGMGSLLSPIPAPSTPIPVPPNFSPSQPITATPNFKTLIQTPTPPGPPNTPPCLSQSPVTTTSASPSTCTARKAQGTRALTDTTLGTTWHP
ncbi:hypothetical protein O3P69_009726 [Scylla paramamosain]|uniref:Uncharacterized protein n=1 Tax=Scylla paramamosain TaxID=85552 RepID=A0AAW0SEJ9_SCYPA